MAASPLRPPSPIPLDDDECYAPNSPGYSALSPIPIDDDDEPPRLTAAAAAASSSSSKPAAAAASSSKRKTPATEDVGAELRKTLFVISGSSGGDVTDMDKSHFVRQLAPHFAEHHFQAAISSVADEGVTAQDDKGNVLTVDFIRFETEADLDKAEWRMDRMPIDTATEDAEVYISGARVASLLEHKQKRKK